MAKSLELTNWSVFSVLLSSSYSGWGTSSLDQDVEEIGSCVQYIRALKRAQCSGEEGMIALMGHSTGSQDVLHYIYSPKPLKRPQVDGAILQAPVSDRENLLQFLKSGDGNLTPEAATEIYDKLVEMAKTNMLSGCEDSPLPQALTSRIGYDVVMSSYRFLSLASPDSPDSPLDDDLFSSDLIDDQLLQTFGAIGHRGLLGKSLLVIPGGADEYVPDWVDKEKLLDRWEKAVKQGAGGREVWDANSGLIKGSQHSPSGQGQEEPRKELISRVRTYLTKIEKC